MCTAEFMDIFVLNMFLLKPIFFRLNFTNVVERWLISRSEMRSDDRAECLPQLSFFSKVE